ncbi:MULTISPECIES: hypothetical protein [unclassified Nostoc]|uniref:hypothetical protein n=1 Tax=unclassified Nostoc TaxID=2593658 RepID=UPI002AD5F5E2|nr:hypothetical protein [Nostoc sp. DedQUE02]
MGDSKGLETSCIKPCSVYIKLRITNYELVLPFDLPRLLYETLRVSGAFALAIRSAQVAQEPRNRSITNYELV